MWRAHTQEQAEPPLPKVRWWLTSADKTNLYTEQNELTWEPYDGQPGARPLIVDRGQQYQTMVGFGAAMTDAATSVIGSMPEAARDQLMDECFAESGMHLDVVRLPIGSSDFARFAYTYDDNNGQPDPNLDNFSIEVDEEYTIPLLKLAKQRNPKLKLFAAPWSPPAWMKTPAELNGGELNTEYSALYAQYFVKFIQAYQEHGLDIYAVAPQNEPLHTTDGYPSMSMSAAQQVTFVNRFLGPAFENAGLQTKIIAYDHNWENTAYALEVLGNAGQYVAGSAWHAYGGEPSAQSVVHDAFPDKDIYFTEITASQPGNFAGDLQWFMRNIGIGAPQNWARTAIYWNLALNESNGPLNGGYTRGQGAVRVTNGAVSERYSTYYGLLHVSHELQQGATRIGCTSYGTGYVLANVYENPDGSTVCHILCDALTPQTFKLIEGERSISLTLNPQDVVTCVW